MNCNGPYQMHACFGPNCALADVKADSALVMCSTQDVYGTRGGVARVLGLPQDKVRVQYQDGAGTYGHSCYDDVAQAAALLSQLAGAPVRLQFMRWDEHGWDNYGPAHVGEVRAAADASGKIVAYEYQGWHHNWANVETSEQLALAKPAAEWAAGAAQMVSQNCGGMYDIANFRLVNHKIPGLRYLKGAWLRSPLDLSFTFTSEQAIDQLAYLRESIRTNSASAISKIRAGWECWMPRRRRRNGLHAARHRICRTRRSSPGGESASARIWRPTAAAVAEIEVNKETGRVVAKHMYGAIDAGLVVNPGNVEAQICGQLVQTCSRMFKEEVKFNTTNVTSLDWAALSDPALRRIAGSDCGGGAAVE